MLYNVGIQKGLKKLKYERQGVKYSQAQEEGLYPAWQSWNIS